MCSSDLGGEAALAAFKDREYDLVLLDFAMPGMNGAQLAGRLLEQRPTQRIVFVSGYSDSAAIDAALNGKAEILAKPVDSQLLLDTVAAA